MVLVQILMMAKYRFKFHLILWSEIERLELTNIILLFS